MKLKIEFFADYSQKIFINQKYFKQEMDRTQYFTTQLADNSTNHPHNQTFTLGRLYKPKESTFFGPTIYLLNRPRERIPQKNATDDREVFAFKRKQQIQQQLDKLKQENNQLKLQKEKWYTFDRLRQQNLVRNETQKLRKHFEQAELGWGEHQRKLKKQITQLIHKNSDLEMKNEHLNQRVNQMQRQIEDTKVRERKKSQISWLNTSRMQMSMFNGSNPSFQKTIQKQVILEKLRRCQEIIKDQKFIIASQKQQINKEKSKQTELTHFYEKEIETLQNQLAFKKHRQSQINEQETKTLANQNKELRKKVIQAEEQIKAKSLIITRQLQTIKESEEKLIQYQFKLKNIGDLHQKIFQIQRVLNIVKNEKQAQISNLNKDIQHYLEEIETLDTHISQYQERFAEKELQVQQLAFNLLTLLKQKQLELKKIKDTDKQRLKQPKINKSLSVHSLSFRNEFKSQVNLSQILNSVVELKTSNDRSRKLLNKTYTKQGFDEG